MSRGDRSRGLTRRCPSCGSSYVKTNMDGVKLTNGAECPKCEATSLVLQLLQRRLDRVQRNDQ